MNNPNNQSNPFVVASVPDLQAVQSGQVVIAAQKCAVDLHGNRTPLLNALFGGGSCNEDIPIASENVPAGTLGEPMEDFVNAVAEQVGTSNGMAAACALATASASIGFGLSMATRPGLTCFPNLYILIGTPSGGCKSITADPVLRPLNNLQQESLENWRRDTLPRLTAEKYQIEAERKRLLSNNPKLPPGMSLLDRLNFIERRIIEIEDSIHEPRLFVENATMEALIQHASRNRGVMANISSDARELISIIGGKYNKGGESGEGFYLKAWSNESYDSPRIGRLVRPMPKTCLTCLWLTQPDKVHQLFGNPNFTQGGLLPRFLVCMADYPPQPVRRDRGTIDARIAADWDALIRSLKEEYHSSSETRSVSVTPEASVAFDEHFDSLVARNSELKPIWIFAARWNEQAYKLALVIHAAFHGREAHLNPLEVGTALAAIAIADWFQSHQLAVLGHSRKQRLEQYIREVLSLYTEDPKRTITATDLTRTRITQTADQAKALLQLMEPTHLYSEARPMEGGGHTQIVYHLTPSNSFINAL